MKIVHICLCDAYSENWSYHRNILSEQNASDGHDTYIITLPYVMDIDGKNGDQEVGSYINKYGITVIRLKGKYKLLKAIQGKLRLVKGLYQAIDNISPDVIMIHNMQSLSISAVFKYKRKHPQVLLLGDSHASFANSCRNFVSRYIIQGFLFRLVVKKYYRFLDEFYFIGLAERDFFEKVYGIKPKKCNILPLPARFIDEDAKRINRLEIREKLNLKSDNTPLFVHSGKMVKEKKTDIIIEALNKCNGDYRLVVVGSIPKESQFLLDKIKNNERITYLGWLPSDELAKYISAADLYLQPGSPSVTMNNALAAGTPVMIQPIDTYQLYYGGWEYIVNDENDVGLILQEIINNPSNVRNKINNAYQSSRKFFDCSVFAKEMYSLYNDKEYKNNFKYNDNGLRIVEANSQE